MQRCLSIGRRIAKPVLVTSGVLLSSIETIKFYLIQSGKIEEALAKVTSSKIGIHEGTKFSRENLLHTLKIFRIFLRPVITTRDSTTLARIEHAIEDMETDVSTGALRKQPYCVMLYGPPGVGKSSFAIQIARAIMMHEYGTFTSFQMVTLNETDEYQSEFRTSHRVVLFDDIAASKAEHQDTKNPWRKVIDFVNNVQKTALNPNCEMKGKVYIQPDLVILTSNIDFSKGWSEVTKTMNCQEAIQRRCQQVIQLHDYESVSFVEYSGTDRHNGGVCGARMLNHDLGKEKLISRSTAVEFLLEDYISHMDSQTKFLNTFNGYFDDFKSGSSTYSPQTEIAPSSDVDGKLSDLSDGHYNSILFNFLLKNVKWDLYWAMYQQQHNSAMYYWDGIIYETWQPVPQTAIHVSKTLMEDLRKYQFPEESDCIEIPNLRAESSTHVRMDAIYGDLDDISSLDLESIPIPGSQLPEHGYIAPDTLPSLIEMYQQLPGESWHDACLRHFQLLLRTWNYTRPPGDDQKLKAKCRRFNVPIESKTYYHIKQCSIAMLPASLHFNVLLGLAIVAGDFDIYLEGRGLADSDATQNEWFDFFIEKISKKYYSESGFQSEIFAYLLSTEPTLEFSKGHVKRYHKRALEAFNNINPPLDEDDQIDQFLEELPYQLRSPLRVERNVRFACIGEVDLLLTYEDFYIVVEFKGVDGHRAKARVQAVKYGEAISVLQPTKRVFGMIVTPGQTAVVYDNGVNFDPDPVGDYFSKLNYSPL